MGMAVVISLMVGLMILGSSHASVMTIWGAATAIALWCVLPQAFAAQKLLKRHPDLYIAEKWKGRRNAPTQTQRGLDIQAETRRQKKQGLIKMLMFVGFFAAFVVVVMLMKGSGDKQDPLVAEERPVPSFGSRAENFRRAWNEGEWKHIEEFLPPAHRARRGPKIRRLLKKRGWDQQRPKLLSPRIDRGSYTKATYNIDGFESDIVFVIYWDAGETNWWWAKTRWPKTELVKR